MSSVVFLIEFLSKPMVGIKKGEKILAFFTLKKSLRAAASGRVHPARLEAPHAGSLCAARGVQAVGPALVPCKGLVLVSTG